MIILSHYLFLGPLLFLNLGLVGAQVTHFIDPFIYLPPEMLMSAPQPIGPGLPSSARLPPFVARIPAGPVLPFFFLLSPIVIFNPPPFIDQVFLFGLKIFLHRGPGFPRALTRPGPEPRLAPLLGGGRGSLSVKE